MLPLCLVCFSIGCGSGIRSKTAQTITLGALPNLTYGAGPVALTATASSGLPVSYTATGPAAVSGSTLIIVGAGQVTVTASQAGNADFAPASAVSQSFTVAKAVLTATAANLSRQYDVATPALTYAVTGFVNGDTSAVVSGTATTTTTATLTSPLGSYPITFATEALSAVNYSFTYVPGTLTVLGGTAQTITLGALPNLTYGAGPVALTATASSGLPVSYTATGPAAVSGSTLTIVGAGQVTVTASQAGNADFAPASAVSQSFTVAKAVLTATAANLSRQYDVATPALTYAVTGFVNGDTSAVVSGTATTTTTATLTSPLGSYPITFATEALSAVNYSFTYVPGTLTVLGGTAQTITLGALPNLTYGAGPVALTATASSGLPVSYTATGPAAVSGSTLTIVGAGQVTVTASQAGNADFAPASAVSQSFTVAKAVLTATAANLSRQYDVATPALTYAVTGFVNGDTSAVVSGTATTTTTATLTSPLGSYPITFATEALSAVNYSFTYVPGTLTVLGGTAQTITLGALPNLTYGAGPVALTATASSGLPVSYTATGPAAVSGSTLTIVGAGQVTVTASQAGNADFAPASAVSQSFTVAKAVLTATAANLSRQYDVATPALTYAVTGFVNGDTSAVVSGTATTTTTATLTSPLGSYPITFATEALSAVNYSFTYVPGTLTVLGGTAQTITLGALPNLTYGAGPVALTATASSGLPVSYTATGPAAVSGSTLTIVGAGQVTVTASQAGNADFAPASAVSQSFTVAKAVLTATAANLSRQYDVATPALTYAVTGFVNGDTSAVVSGTATTTTTATLTSPLGSYPITFATEALSAVNYSFTYVPGTLTVLGGPVSSGLVGWWPLNEGTGTVAHDISGQGNDGTWSGTPSSPSGTYYTTGETSPAAGYFNGTDNGLIIGTQPIYEFTGPFTISMWINPANSSAEGISAREQSINNSHDGYFLSLHSSTPQFCLVTAGNPPACAAGTGVGVGAWTLLTTVWDGTNMCLYINGTLISQVPSDLPPPANTSSLAFGIPEQGGQNRFNGSLNDIRIYSRALSAIEISSLYNAHIGPPNAPTNLQAFPGDGQVGLSWNNPSSGAIITDYTVNYRQTGTSIWTAFPHSPFVVNQEVVAGLTNAISYDFEVIGINSAGAGIPSTIVTTTPSSVPPAITVNVSPPLLSTASGNNVAFAATVTNALNTSVTWSAHLGTITSDGLYTAPSNTGSNTVSDTIIATSNEDPTKSATVTVTVSSGLIGRWPLDEGVGAVAHDISGQGNDGTWSGTPSSPSGTYYTTGETSPAAGYFNGTDNSLTIGTQPIYAFTGPFAMSMWINPASSSEETLLAREQFNSNQHNGYFLSVSAPDVQFCLVALGSPAACADGTGVGVGVWTLVTAVYDGTHMSLYTNGTLSSQVSSPLTPPANTSSLAFGTPGQGGQDSFNGSINDIRIYDRALSANEISSLYNAYVGPPNAPTNLQALPGDGQVTLSWDAPTAGGIVTDYTLNYRPSGTSNWTTFHHNPSVVNQQMVTGLMNATSYDFQVVPVSAIGSGAASIIVTATPTSSSPAVVPSDDDEFIGPFSSWLNLKTDFGAVGDGVADDTIALQYALNSLETPSAHASVLYIPAGTYNINSGLNYVSPNCNTYCTGRSIIGESPANTTLKWHGIATGTAMLTLDGIFRMQFDRLTLDGGGAQITLVNETMHQGCCYDGSNEYTDDVFENAAIGIQAGDNTVGCCSAETKVDRDTFSNLTQAGISLEDWNAVDWYVRYSTFDHDHYGVTNSYGAGGAMHLDHNLFEYNDIDSGWGNGADQSYTYNTSYHAGIFLEGSVYGNSSILIGNSVLMPQTAAIVMDGIGPLTLIGNTIEGTITAAQSSSQIFSFADGSASTPTSYVTSVGNTYVSGTPFSVQNVTYGTNIISGGLTSINDAVVPISDLHAALPVMPGPLPNYHRTIYDVPQGASAATMQTTIDQAIAENNGNRPVVHIPWGQYSAASTMTIPSKSDVQVVGDGMQTTINWNGSASSSVFAVLPQSHATIRNLTINAGYSSAGILVEGYDQPGDRIYTNFVANGGPGSSHNLLVNGFDNTLVQMDDFGHGGLANPSSTSVLVVGGPLSQAGTTTPGYTGLFMGSSCCSTSSYRVEDGGTIVLTGFWYEQGGPGWLNLDGGSGTFVGYEDNISVPAGGSAPSFAADKFTGNLTIVNSAIQNGHVSLAGSTAANVLLLADGFAPATVSSLIQPPVVSNTNTNPNTEAATIYSTWLSGSTGYAVPDVVSPGTSRNTLIQNALVQLASYKDPAITDLPNTNEDVRLVDVIVNNGFNGLDLEAIALNSFPGSKVVASNVNTSFGMAATSVRPTWPWCKQLRKEGAAAEVSGMDIFGSRESSRPPGGRSRYPVDRCSVSARPNALP